MELVFCHTNLDVNEEWPSELPRVPCVGEKIESRTRHGHFRLSLKVVDVKWTYIDAANQWAASVELHDTQQRSIREFYEWYAPLVGRSVSAFI